ncbi:hypothetical protein B0H14DRAFT_2780847 [Mycena olivaceomarginata]|nr:hypothetical protein B0H14DRAFT_2780847 [Mycena olivaceomarginata]
MSGLDIDTATAALISQLTLDDIAEIRHLSKGNLDNALELDQPVLSVLSVVEDGLRDDHAYAEALENGRALPAQSEVQRLMEDPDFSRLSQDVTDKPEDGGNTRDADGLEEVEETRPMRAHVAQCVVCRDDLRALTSFQAPCNHFYCRQCLSNLHLPMDGAHGVYGWLDVRLRLSFEKKAVEFATVFKDRLYCPRPTCSVFLGPTIDHLDNVVCPRCATEVCVSCKQTVHPGEACGESLAVQQVKALAREQHWQTCPGCAQIIDLEQGCYHMTCRCRMEFCYVCAARWKTCKCPQWEEARLLRTAEQRVENEMGARARVAAPEIFRQRVEQRIERLRYEHDCANRHRWSRRNGRARCEECRYILPEYLLVCRSCGIAACERCVRNRL